MFLDFHYGNYVGANWSDGKRQASVAKGKTRAIDEFDSSAQVHDRAYALNRDLKKADYAFYKANIGKGVVRSAAAIAVGTQGLFRKSSLPKKVRFMAGPVQLPPTPGQRRPRSASRSTSARRVRSRSAVSPRSASVGASTRHRSRSSARSVSRSASMRSASIVRALRGNRARNRFGNRAGNSLVRASARGNRFAIIPRGVHAQQENGSVVTTDYCCYLGHSSISINELKKGFWRGLVKTLLSKMGKLSADWNSAPFGVAATDHIIVQWRATHEPTIGVGANVDCTVGVLTQEQIAMVFHDAFVSYRGQFQLHRIVFLPVNSNVGAYNMDLTHAKIKYKSQSTLKFQNRSIPSTGADETDNVAAVPLIGKSYEGSGTGTVYMAMKFGAAAPNTNIPFIANQETTVISKTDMTSTATPTSLKNPPPASAFKAKKQKDQYLDAGSIKESTLYTQKSMSVEKFIITIYDGYGVAPGAAGGDIVNYLFKPLGKYRFFAMEKRIHALGADEINVIRLAYECEHQCSVSVSCPNSYKTTSLISTTVT